MVIYNQEIKMVIQNQEKVIALLNEINEVKGNFIDNETANQLTPELKAVWDEIFVCKNEIELILRSKTSMAGKGFFGVFGDVTVAAYLLAKSFDCSAHAAYSFEEDARIDADIKKVAEDFYISENWNELMKLTKAHEQKIFYLVSLLRDLSDPMMTPESLGNLADELLEIKANDKFADFCCGAGTVVADVVKNHPTVEAYGFDKLVSSIAIAKIYNDLSEGKITFEAKDIFELGLDEDNGRCFDKIFANYPFGMRIKELGLGNQYLEQLEKRIPSVSKATSSDWLFNSVMVDMLSEDGKAVGIMTNGSTWNQSDSAIRSYFIENGLIECVIALPARLFAGTAIATSMIVFSRNNKGVRLVDASELFVEGRRVNELSYENISLIINATKNDSDISMYVSAEQLRDNDYVLSMNRYIVHDVADGMAFGDVIKRITRGAQLNAKALDEITTTVPTDMQYLMLANIKNGLIDKELPYLKSIDKKNDKYCLSNHCLILSKNGYPYKIAVAEVKEGQRILGNGNLYIIELDEEKADPYYLAAFFGSEQGTAALRSITVGATIPNIGVEQLTKLVIPIPPLEKQKEIADKYKTVKDEITMLQLKLEKAKNRMAHIIE